MTPVFFKNLMVYKIIMYLYSFLANIKKYNCKKILQVNITVSMTKNIDLNINKLG